ncbi:uncharacterized protein DS421_11g347100 [Arachis hypogaea]|nr:uncharacterized protein DS421_11g347100 [Arachis hypogaea]
MEPAFRYVNALRNIQQSYNQFYVFGLFAKDWYTTTDLYFIDTQDKCLHLTPKRDGDRFWIKAADIGRIRRMYRRSPLLSVELRYVSWGVFYMIIRDINRKEEPPFVVDEQYASKVLPEHITHSLESRCGAYFNKEAQLRVFETEMFLRVHQQSQEYHHVDTQQSNVNKRQQGGGWGAEAGPSKRQRPTTSPDAFVNQGSS